MKNIFDVREYVERVYGNDVLNRYEEDYGLNGLDYLWSCSNEKEVDDKLSNYLE